LLKKANLEKLFLRKMPIFALQNRTIMAHDNHANHQPKGIWYTYFGETGASVVAFLWVLAALVWIFSVVKWG
jgi:hypothetical protein